ncbi:hypothetical protein HZR02_08715 [Elizabethkingia anophelis]|jgi:hypothetical protein|nr:hypothetical protein [Elizabethkingia anophelis]MCT3658973.1 hypothetical protein [Elizabethkingia anophelis]MCT3666138.1 hypothetical protein [Elizabethkingia anophelis]MCT3852231.1 hypothetical protein [Elizabethkingia anophelis]MCT3863048.1 hypothetical protein [Elizabethkingia anophelis]
MKSISINLFSIDELSQEAQEQAFEKYRHFNVEDGSWYEGEYEDFTAICKTIGVIIDNDGIFFSGFWSQGDGSTFKSTIDEVKFIKGINSEAWKEYAPTLELNFKECPCDKQVIRLIEKGLIECSCITETPNRGYWLETWTDYHFIPSRETELPNIDYELEKLDKWLRECLNRLNNYLYKSLEKQYEFETSDESLKEAFAANEYLFTADGKMANNLLNLAI